MGDRSGEAKTLGNKGILFQNTNRPTEAITDLEKSLQIVLEMRRGLQQQNRQKFLQQYGWSATALVNVLIEQKQYNQAFAWVNKFGGFKSPDSIIGQFCGRCSTYYKTVLPTSDF